jgi:hypothetical protein
MPPALWFTQRGEWLARVARRARPFGDHFVAIRLETLDPANERRREKDRLVEHADECDRQTNPARMNQNLSAIVQGAIDGAIDLGNRRQPRIRRIFCISKTTIGTLDELANVRRLTTEVTRVPFFQGRNFSRRNFLCRNLSSAEIPGQGLPGKHTRG